MSREEYTDIGDDTKLEEQTEDGKQKTTLVRCLQSLLSTAIALLMVFAMALSVACAQALGGYLPHFQLNFWRYLAQLMLVLPTIISQSLSVLPERRQVIWVLLAGLTSISYNICYYTAATYLPSGTLGGVMPSASLITAAVVTLVIYREFSWHVTASVLVCVTGIVLVSQPQFIFGESAPEQYHPVCGRQASKTSLNVSVNSSMGNTSHAGITDEYAQTNAVIGYCLAVATAWSLVAQAFIANKKLSEMNCFVLSVWVAIIGVAASAGLMFIFEDFVSLEKSTCLFVLVGHAFGAGGASVISLALVQLIGPVMLTLWMTFQVVVLFVSQYTVMKSINPGKGNAAEIVGAVVIFVGNVISPAFQLYTDIKGG